MRALVTGGCGFVGGYLCEHLREQGDQVLVTTLFPPKESVPYEVVTVDITDRLNCRSVIEAFNPDVIYHLAAISFVPEAEENFDIALRINVAGTENIYSAARALNRDVTVVLVSSAEVFGRITPADLPISESTPLRPVNNYSLSKVMAELVAERYSRESRVRSVIMRPFNHLGAGQDNRFVASSFAWQLARIAKGLAAPVLRVGNLEAERDFSDVRDIVRGYRSAAVHGKGVYVLSSGRAIPVRTLLDNLIEISGLQVKVEQDPARMRPAEVPRLCGAFDRARNELGWEPRITLRQTLSDVYAYWLSRS